jgi:phasin family protein
MEYYMADETKIETKAAAEAPAKVIEAVAETTQKVVAESAKAGRTARTKARRQVNAAKRVQAAAKTRATRKTTRRINRAAKAKPAAAVRKEGIAKMTFDPTNIFAGFNGANTFQNLFGDAGERGQEAVKKSQKVAEQLVELTRANVEAVVEAGKIAAEGSRSIAQDVVAKSRANVEQAADVVRSLAEAKSPTEFMQLQSEFARTSFDRLVSESSKLTETMVKLAGDAIQPISNRATANAERFNELVA